MVKIKGPLNGLEEGVDHFIRHHFAGCTIIWITKQANVAVRHIAKLSLVRNLSVDWTVRYPSSSNKILVKDSWALGFSL